MIGVPVDSACMGSVGTCWDAFDQPEQFYCSRYCCEDWSRHAFRVHFGFMVQFVSSTHGHVLQN